MGLFGKGNCDKLEFGVGELGRLSRYIGVREPTEVKIEVTQQRQGFQ